MSLVNKMGALELRMDDFRKEGREPQIVAVTETWGKDSDNFNLKKFNMYRNDRGDGRGGQFYM